MLVTINTDASWCPETKKAAYAFWAVSNSFKITKSGVFKNKCESSRCAETRCIINALSTVLLSNSGISKVIVNTDSKYSIWTLEEQKINKQKWKSNLYLHIAYKTLLKNDKNKAKIEFRHVKAHSGVQDSRSYVNKWCDKEAKKQLRRIRNN